MLFIGPTNNGKSSIISAIMFFLGYRNLRTKDIRNQNIPLELEGTFQNISKNTYKHLKEFVYKRELTLKIQKYPNYDIQYKVKINKNWKIISEETYREIVLHIPILYIPPFQDKEQISFLVNSLFEILKRRNISESLMINSLKKLANTLQNDYVSKGLYRNLLFEVLVVYLKNHKREIIVL